MTTIFKFTAKRNKHYKALINLIASSPLLASAPPSAMPPTSGAPEPLIRVDLGDNSVLEMVYIPGGHFWMGSPESELERLRWEGPQHWVSVPPFYMGKYPITQRQWRAVSLLSKVKRFLDPAPSRFKGDNLPVERVNWYEAVEFCQRLNRLLPQDYRLPSEAEWEYACRAGTQSSFSFGDTLSTDQANYNGNRGYGPGKPGFYRGQPTPVGSFPANGFGLYDLHGNVWEWCADHWHKNYEGAPDDGGPWLSSDNHKSRVVRGGSWYSDPADCRSANRDSNFPGNTPYNNSFRVACSVLRM